MEGQRQLGPSRIQDSGGNQLNPQINGLPQTVNFSGRHPMHLNGPQSRPSAMTVSGGQQQQPTITVQNPTAIQPGTVYLIRGPNGDLQLVRLTSATPTATMGLQQQRQGPPMPQMPPGLRFPTQPQQLVGSTPVQQHLQGAISVPSGLAGHMQGHQSHGPNSMLPGMGMRPQIHTSQPSQPSSKIDDPLSKAKQFFNALLSMSKGQSPAMHQTARDLLQQLVDGIINPDEFARRLQEELKSTPQPILAPLLKVCLHQMRLGLMNGEIAIDGITPPPPSALSATDSSLRPSVATSVNSVFRDQEHKPNVARPPVPKQAPQKKHAQKSIQGTSSVHSVVSSVGSEMQHPVFSQIEQLHPHSKIEKLKSPKVADKKSTAKQKRQNQLLQDQKSKSDQDGATVPVSSRESKEQKADDDELNDVAAMGGVNLNEESARLASADIVGTQTRSIDDQTLLPGESIRKRISTAVRGLVSEDVSSEVLTIISHAVEARIRNCCERLNVIAEHRSESVRGHSHYRPTHDIRGQLKFMEELDRVEKRRREEEEKEALLRAAKSRNRPEDPEHMKLKQKAKELQRVEQEELRTREANQAALAALVGGRKRPRPDSDGATVGPSLAGIGKVEAKSQPYRPRIKRVCLRDVVFMAETDPKLSKSPLLYQILNQIK